MNYDCRYPDEFTREATFTKSSLRAFKKGDTVLYQAREDREYVAIVQEIYKSGSVDLYVFPFDGNDTYVAYVGRNVAHSVIRPIGEDTEPENTDCCQSSEPVMANLVENLEEQAARLRDEADKLEARANDPDVADFDKRFNYHPPKNQAQINAYQRIRTEARYFATAVTDECPQSRERSLAMTKIEEASFWANAAIARRT